MDAKASFKKLMDDRHSARLFKSKEIPQDILKDIIATSLKTPSWCSSQPWTLYIASGKTLEEIRKVWILKSKDKVKGYADMAPGHRTNYSERSRNSMEDFFKTGGVIKDGEKTLESSNYEMFNAPTLVYLTLPKGYTNYSVLDLGAIEMSIMLSAKSQGVDSIPAYTTIMYPDVLRKFCKIPDTEDIIIGVALGYEDENSSLNKYRSKKLTLDECCHFFN